MGVQSDQIERLLSIGFAIQTLRKGEPATNQKQRFTTIFSDSEQKIW